MCRKVKQWISTNWLIATETILLLFIAIPTTILIPHIQHIGNIWITDNQTITEKCTQISKYWAISSTGANIMIATFFILLILIIILHNFGNQRSHKEMLEMLKQNNIELLKRMPSEETIKRIADILEKYNERTETNNKTDKKGD